MFPKPLRDDGLKEPPMAYDAKRLWAITKYNDTYNEITFDYFLHNFKEMIESASFDWKHDTYPNPKTAARWPGKYDWKGCCTHYENYKLGNSKKEANLIYDKKYLQDTITDFKKIDRLNQRHEALEEMEKYGEDQTYRKAKIEEEIDSIWSRIRTRLGLDIEQDNPSETKIIPINPEHEDQHIRDIWTERARQDVIPR
jgi:hypothetical protein